MADSGIRIRSWIFYLSLVVFVAALVIAIALPVTFAKQDEGTTVRKTEIVEVPKTIYSYRSTEFPRYDPIPEEDPFTIWQVSQKARDAYSALDWVGKIGQTTLYAWGDASGPGGSDGSDWGPLIKRNAIGSLINVNSFAERQEYSSYVPENGIPVLYGYDTIHGYKVIFPINLGMAAAWSPEVIKEYVKVAAYETKADGVPWTFAPMVDLARDQRWGRVMEGAGEDPFLVGTLSRAYVEEFQANGVASCVKHLAGYGGIEGGVDYTGAHIDEAQLFNDYMRAYDLAIQDGDPTMPMQDRAWTIMASFNLWDGIPSHGNRKLLTDVLRGHWNFTGFVVADYLAVDELVYHGVAATCEDAGKMSLYAGVDMNMQDGCHAKAFMTIVDLGDENTPATIEVNMDAVNSLAPDGRPYGEHIELAARRVIALKDKLGLFDKPLPDEEPVFLKPEHLAKSQEVAEKAMVLLQNNGALPIAKDSKNRVLLTGRIASSAMDQDGFWFGRGRDGDAMAALRKYHIGMDDYLANNNAGTSLNPSDNFKPGYRLMITPQPEAVAMGHHLEEIAEDEAARKDLLSLLETEIKGDGVSHVIVLVGENVTMTGESASRSYIGLGGSQLKFLQEIVELKKANSATFKIIEVINAGRGGIISEFEQQEMDAIVMAWCPGTMAGDALPRLLFGDLDFSGKTPVTFPRNMGQVPIYYSRENSPRGEDADWESNGDWTPILPVEGLDLGKGAEYAYKSQYIDSWNSPAYPFGFGLHYTDFTYTGAGISPASLSVTSNDSLKATVTLTRSDGTRPSAEIVQVYMSALWRQPAPATKKLVGFQRVEFGAGETTKNVEIDIPIQKHFSYYDNNLKKVITPGTFTIYIGKDSNDVTNKFTFTLTE